MKPKLIKHLNTYLLMGAIAAPAMLFSQASFAVTAPPPAPMEVASIDATIEADSAALMMDAKAANVLLADALKVFTKARASKFEAADRQGIADFYKASDYKTIWMSDGKLSTEARALVYDMSMAKRHGLNPADYTLAFLNSGEDYSANTVDVFSADLEMSLAAVRYARHIASGRLVPQNVSASLDMNPERPNAKATLEQLANAADPLAEIATFHPKHPQYKALLKELAAVQDVKPVKQIVVGKGRLLKPGKSDPRVPDLRARLKVAVPIAPTPEEGETAAEIDENIYDEALVAAVKEFQKENRLSQDGVVGPATLRVMNGDRNIDRKSQIIVNLERWRWMPKDLGKFHVFANIPEYRVYVRDNGKVVHTTRVVVGKTKHKTVAFTDKIEHFVVNPSWGVPKSIIKNEMLPSARANRSYFSKRGYQVFARIRGRMRRVDPSRVNWRNVSASQIQVRQPPGARNALGRIKFMFPNKHSIYMHDTPSKSLFKRDARAFSHGCVRIHNPLEFAGALLRYEPKWSVGRIEKLIGGKEATVKLGQSIPVHIAYFTAITGDNDAIIYKRDVYGHDAKMIKALKL
ncbi:MAG: L,D-transpeptidase family protein [Rhizobiales bacterium]|nr:L,D-transpeptidase family protein [Hyphomicrobiales bacterium]